MNSRTHHAPAKSRENHRLCCHVASGRTRAPKICLRNHECYHCGYDQWLDHSDEGTRSEETGILLGGYRPALAA